MDPDLWKEIATELSTDALHALYEAIRKVAANHPQEIQEHADFQAQAEILSGELQRRGQAVEPIVF